MFKRLINKMGHALARVGSAVGHGITGVLHSPESQAMLKSALGAIAGAAVKAGEELKAQGWQNAEVRARVLRNIGEAVKKAGIQAGESEIEFAFSLALQALKKAPELIGQ